MHIMHCIGPGVVNCSALFENIFHKTFYFSFQWVWKKYLYIFIGCILCTLKNLIGHKESWIHSNSSLFRFKQLIIINIDWTKTLI